MRSKAFFKSASWSKNLIFTENPYFDCHVGPFKCTKALLFRDKARVIFVWFFRRVRPAISKSPQSSYPGYFRQFKARIFLPLKKFSSYLIKAEPFDHVPLVVVPETELSLVAVGQGAARVAAVFGGDPAVVLPGVAQILKMGIKWMRPLILT